MVRGCRGGGGGGTSSPEPPDDGGASEASSFAEFKSIAEGLGFRIWKCEPMKKTPSPDQDNNRYNSMNRAWLAVRAGRNRLSDYHKETWLPLGYEGGTRRRRLNSDGSQRGGGAGDKTLATGGGGSSTSQLPAVIDDVQPGPSVPIPANPTTLTFAPLADPVWPSRDFDARTCQLCGGAGDGDPGVHGRLLNVDVDVWIHVNCAVWSTEVVEDGYGVLSYVQDTIKAAVQQRCHLCSDRGATVGCRHPKCLRTYHFHCARRGGCAMHTNRLVFCAEHKEPRPHYPLVSDFRSLRSLVVARPEPLLDSARSKGAYIRMGGLTLVSTGTVNFVRDAFHTKDYIYPIGLTTKKVYWSTYTPYTRVVYTSHIACEDDRALFVVSHPAGADGSRALRIVAPTPEDAWRKVQEKVLALWQAEASSMSVHGQAAAVVRHSAARRAGVSILPGYNERFLFGLNPSVCAWIENLPGASNCRKYKKHEELRQLRPHEAADEFASHSAGCARTHPHDEEEYEARKKHFRAAHGAEQPAATDEIQKLDMMQLVPVGTTARNDVASGNRTTNECLELDVSVLTESQQYRRLAEVSRSSTYVAKSMIQGMGVRAARPFKEGEMVIEYVGELVRKQISEHRERMYNLRGVGCYMFGVPNHDLVIDATMKGGPARFINHSCDPNCVSKCLVIDKQPRIVIVATRDIATDEEFCYDYKFDLDETDKVPCNCGAEKCRGFMN
eukprot:m.151153 g.151153  ORF g.151153 m.151153 type:complete len:724 (+) comp11695_c0_seq3:500-2671(+)